MPSAPTPSSCRSSNYGSEVNRLSKETVDPAFTSHFSIKPNTTSAPWPKPVSCKSVSTLQYGSAWRRYSSDEMMHQSLNPNLIGFPLIKNEGDSISPDEGLTVSLEICFCTLHMRLLHCVCQVHLPNKDFHMELCNTLTAIKL